MPLPKPNTDESHDDFIDRCMSNDTMQSEFPDEDQRYAVCQTQWNKKEVKSLKQELTAPIVAKNEEKRIVYGPVLVPDEPDTDGDIVSAEKIEEVAHKFLKDYRNVDLQHSLNNVAEVVESYITPVELSYELNGETVIIPKGSWIMAAYIANDKVWKRVQNGELTGYSIMAIENVNKAKKENAATKRATLADLDEDWIVNVVSLVDEPAVPKAKWVAIKSRKGGGSIEDTAKKNLLQTITDAVKSALGLRDGGVVVKEPIANGPTENIVGKEIIAGETMEDNIDEQLKDRVKEYFGPAEDAWVWIRDIFPQYAVVEYVDYNETEPAGLYKIPYVVENDVLRISGQPEKVEIQEILVAAEKAGRTISDANKTKLENARDALSNAIDAIEGILSIAEQERVNKSKGDDNVNKDELKDAIKSVLDEELEDIKKSIDELKAEKEQLEQEKKEAEKAKEEVEKEKEKVEKEKEEEIEEKDKSIKELEAKVDELLKATAKSKRIIGQDDDSDAKEPVKNTRDAFGRKIKKNKGDDM